LELKLKLCHELK